MQARREKLTVYERVANQIVESIRKNTLLPGDKIPSLRRMHREMGASVTSVLQAYILLENRGIIESRPQSGYYVRRVNPRAFPLPQSQSPTRFAQEIDEYVVQSFMRATTDPKVIQLGESTPCPDLLPTKNLCRIVGKLCRDTPDKLVRFENPQGNLELRREISRLSVRTGDGFAPEDLLVTNGGYESWNLCFRALTSPGDTVLIESPTYFGVPEILKSLGLNGIELPTHTQKGVDLVQTEGLLKAKKIKLLFILPHFAKPFPGKWTDTTKRALVDLFAKYEIPIVEADVYRDFYFGATPPTRLKDFDTQGLIVHCGSFSKTVSSGFRLAWLAPGRFKESILRLKFLSSIAAPTLSQLAVAEYLAKGSFERHLRVVRKKLGQRLAIYTDVIANSFPEGTRVSRPDGGFVLWIQLPAEVEACEVFRRALRENIVIAPGPIFSLTGQYRNFIRLSFGNSWSPKVEKAVATVAKICCALATPRGKPASSQRRLP